MTRASWHITRTDSALTLSRRLPAQFDVAVETVLPAADPLRLAHQIRQDMWRKLQSLRGFSPVVEITAHGQGLRVRAGGQVMGRVPFNAAGLIADVLEHPGNRARWLRHARQRKGGLCPETGPKAKNPHKIAAKIDMGSESVS
ncbi:hypothetical protein RA19_05445 [Leisingera sp. ANG-M1]|uniref:hypothetical protein n=1 Tax=Leisingera sp. ANG-M1 TaxID=1577895 RepID=UPI00057C948F|nr:hypothetical protein [Leisingera sp. ANG-M1]KIC11488.1 hypothetical protein RA19_05445 [Leisingera sp. ANG-M1]